MKSVLVVEDEPDLGEAIADALRDEGYTVQVAHHGAAALKLLQERPFQLMLADMMMPVMDGGTLLKRVRSEARLAKMPVILMSAATVAQDARALADAFLCKPFELHLLARTVSSLVAPGEEEA